jgi:predicted GH43/DUF377 family glycosyl hydrolase
MTRAQETGSEKLAALLFLAFAAMAKKDGHYLLYYGGADRYVGVAEATLK